LLIGYPQRRGVYWLVHQSHIFLGFARNDVCWHHLIMALCSLFHDWMTLIHLIGWLLQRRVVSFSLDGCNFATGFLISFIYFPGWGIYVDFLTWSWPPSHFLGWLSLLSLSLFSSSNSGELNASLFGDFAGLYTIIPVYKDSNWDWNTPWVQPVFQIWIKGFTLWNDPS